MKFDPKYRGILLAMGLVAMTLAAYWPAMKSGGFIWDDNDYVLENKTLVDAKGLKDIWLSPRATPQYYPLVHTSYWIEYRFWELDPTGYHVTNVLLHALAAILLWLVLSRLKIPGAWLAGALFAVHPVHVESVAWITERKNVLSGVFYLAAALSYLKWVDAKADGTSRRSTYALALFLFICALLSKTVTSTLPAALLLVAWWKDGRNEPQQENPTEKPKLEWFTKHILPLLPFFVIGISLSLITVWLEKHHVGAKGEEWDFSFIDRCLIAGRALWFYIAKLLWPAELIFNYTRWKIDSAAWWQYLYPLSFGALVIGLWAARNRIGRGPLVSILFFAGTLTPALGFFDVYPMRYSFVADHFQYLASIGILILVAGGLHRAFAYLVAMRKSSKTTGTDGGTYGIIGSSAIAIMLGVLGILSAKQCKIYTGLEALWLDTIERNPESFMSYNNLGQIYLHDNRLKEAIPLFEKSLRLNPNEVTAINNLGVSLVGIGEFEKARLQYEKAIELHPDNPQAYHNYGALLAKQGKIDDAIRFYEKALETDPEMIASHINLGIALTGENRFEEAIRHYEDAIAIEPEFAIAYLKFGETLQAADRIREAADQFRQALSYDPTIAAAHTYLGMIAVSDELLHLSVDHFRQAAKAAPDSADAHKNLANVLAATNEFGQAARSFEKAVELAPDAGSIRFEYASFLVNQGNKQLARQEFLKAAELMPGVPDPLFEAAVMDLQLDDPAAAYSRFQKVLKLAPNHAPTYNHLAVLLASQGKNLEASELLQRAIKLESENAEYYNNLGVILVRAGEQQRALEALKKAVQLKPDYAEAKKNLDDLKGLMNRIKQP